MQQLILILHVLVAMAIIALVLMQHGRGADVGAAFGSGASNTMFGSAGSLPFLMKVTAICAAIFFVTSLSLSYLATRQVKQSQVFNIPTSVNVPAKKVESDDTAGNKSEPDKGLSFIPKTNN